VERVGLFSLKRIAQMFCMVNRQIDGYGDCKTQNWDIIKNRGDESTENPWDDRHPRIDYAGIRGFKKE
jgi:hypothetical protein